MSSKAKHKQTAKKGRRTPQTPRSQRTLGYVVLAFFIGAILGFAIGFEPQDGGVERTDSHGRSPGDPHYGHKHS